MRKILPPKPEPFFRYIKAVNLIPIETEVEVDEETDNSTSFSTVKQEDKPKVENDDKMIDNNEEDINPCKDESSLIAKSEESMNPIKSEPVKIKVKRTQKIIEWVDKKERTHCSDQKLICARTILQQIEIGATNEETENYLDDIALRFNEEAKIEFFIPCILFAGSSSFSQQFKLFERYKTLVVKMTASRADYQLKIIELVQEF